MMRKVSIKAWMDYGYTHIKGTHHLSYIGAGPLEKKYQFTSPRGHFVSLCSVLCL